MGLDHSSILKQDSFDLTRELPIDQQLRAQEDIKGLEDETHVYAFFS
jgi:hypothetical protein